VAVKAAQARAKSETAAKGLSAKGVAKVKTRLVRASAAQVTRRGVVNKSPSTAAPKGGGKGRKGS
jgi:hypothetical protein